MNAGHTPSQFGRLQTGRNPRASRNPTVRCLCARQARIGAGLVPLPEAGADIPLFLAFARPLAGRSRVYPRVQTGAAWSPATNSNRAAGRPVPPRVRPRATNAVEEQSSAARTFRPLRSVFATRVPPERLPSSATQTMAGRDA